jgi:hypothetical protein
MVRNLFARSSCVVCGIQPHRHQGWFLVVENRWLDRIKVLAWHPVLARQAAMQSVCCEGDLKTLLTHWLTHANLHFLATETPAWVAGDHVGVSEADAAQPLGKLVGELAVHREALSRVWTGSPEALECILNALVQGLGPKPRAAAVSPASRTAPIYAS